MEGTVKSFLPSKGYGFVRGDDGNDYYLHGRDMLDGHAPRQGLRVAFEEAATPKGYRARRVRQLAAAIGGRYVTPSQVVETKGSEFAEWEVLESIPWYIIGTSRDSPDAAQADLRAHAREIGANAVMLVQYFKTKGSEAGTGRGVHHFTIHNFRAVPAVVGRAAGSEGAVREDLVGMSREIEQVAGQLARKREERRRRGIVCIVAGVAAMGVGVALAGPMLVVLIPGVVILLLAKDFFQHEDLWLEPMGRNR